MSAMASPPAWTNSAGMLSTLAVCIGVNGLSRMISYKLEIFYRQAFIILCVLFCCMENSLRSYYMYKLIYTRTYMCKIKIYVRNSSD